MNIGKQTVCRLVDCLGHDKSKAPHLHDNPINIWNA